MFKSRQFIIGIAISLFFLVWALSNEDLGQVGRAILDAQYWALAPALALYFGGVWVRALRWRILLRPIVPRLGLVKTFEIVVIGYMANNMLPARIGELVRAYVLSMRESVRKTATLATILVERIFDGLVMVGFAAVVLLIVTALEEGSSKLSTGSEHRLGTILSDWNNIIPVIAALLLVVLVVFVAVASSRERAESAVNLALRFLPGGFRERAALLASSFIDGLGSLRSVSGMAAVFGLSIAAWLFEASMYYVIGTWGFELKGFDGGLVPFYVYVLATALINLGTLVPQAPGYIGVFEVIGKVVLVGAFGVDSNAAISYVLVLHAALLVPVTLLGFVFLARESLSWRDLTNLEKSRAQASKQAHELEGPLTDIELVQEGKITEGDDVAETDGIKLPGEDRKADTGEPSTNLDMIITQPKSPANPREKVN